MENNFVEYIIKEWSNLLSLVGYVFIGFFILKTVWNIATDLPSKFMEFDMQDQVYSEGDLVITKKDAKFFMNQELTQISTCKLWIVVSFQDGLYTLQNYQFNGCIKPATNAHITIYKRSE